MAYILHDRWIDPIRRRRAGGSRPPIRKTGRPVMATRSMRSRRARSPDDALIRSDMAARRPASARFREQSSIASVVLSAEVVGREAAPPKPVSSIRWALSPGTRKRQDDHRLSVWSCLGDRVVAAVGLRTRA